MRTKACIAILFAAALGCEGEPDTTTARSVKVVADGEGEAQTLAVSVPKGHKETLGVELALTATGVVNGKDSPDSAITPLTFEVEFEVTEAGKYIRANLEVAKLAVGAAIEGGSELSNNAHKRLRRAIDKMPKLKGELVVTPTGFATKLELGSDKGLSNQQRQVIELIRNTIGQLVIARPESIKSSGRWTVEHELSRNGFNLVQAQDLTLEKNGEIRLTFEEKPGKDVTSASPPGVYADSVALSSYAGGGSGQLSLDSARIFPSQAVLELAAKTELRVEQAGKMDSVLSKATLTIKAKSL